MEKSKSGLVVAPNGQVTPQMEVGADSLVLATDLGQQGMMTPPDGIENAVAALRAAGVSQADLDKMMKRNPARLLGLQN